MEEITKRLHSANATICRRAVSKLVKSILKKTTGTVSSSCKLPELALLWEQCAEGSSGVCNLCSTALINLVPSGNAEPSYMFNGFLSVLPSARNPSTLLGNIVNLWLHVKLKNPSMHEYYLVELLKVRSDISALLMEKILHSLRYPGKILPETAIFFPVLKYVWLNPLVGFPSDCISTDVFGELTKSCPLSHDVYNFSLNILLKMQLRTTKQLHDFISLLRKLSMSLVACSSTGIGQIEIERLDHAVVLCLAGYDKALEMGNNCELLLNEALEIVVVLSEHASTFYSDVAYLLTCYILTQGVGHIATLLRILDGILNRVHITSPIAFSALFPLLQLHAGIDIDEKQLTPMKINLIRKMESVRSSLLSNRLCNSVGLHVFSSTCFDAIVTAQIMNDLELISDAEEKHVCFKKMAEQYNVRNKSSDCTFILITSLIRRNLGDGVASKHLFNHLYKALESNSAHSVGVFPFVLYCINLESDPDCQFEILQTLPCLGKYSVCVASVLSTLQLLSMKELLRAQALRCMTQLWKKNLRTFPFLHKMILQLSSHVHANQDYPPEHRQELLFAISSTVKDVCDISPTNYGSEVLVPLSDLLNKCKSEVDYPASSMAWQAIYSLCSSEVVDVRTVWKVLEPILRHEKRATIVKRSFELLSLAPQLYLPIPVYDQFMKQVVLRLWKHINHSSCPVTCGASYKALSKFTSQYHLLEYIPQSAKSKLKLPEHMISTPLDLGKNPEDVLDYVPGECYISLLKSITDPIILENYGHFLSSLVVDEVTNLPRSVYTTASKAVRTTATNHFLNKIPSFLCAQYEANRLPSLKGSLAVGVLLSYEPPSPTGRDSNSVKRSLQENVQFCERVLEALLQDVPLDNSDWNRSPLLPNAWISFVDVVFRSCEEGHQAGIDLLSTEAKENATSPAWILARNGLIEVIKNGSKGKPSSHANAILALTGIVVAVKNFSGSLQSQNESEDEWLVSAVETILCIAMPERKPAMAIFGWLLKNPYKSSKSGTAVVQGSAITALSHLVTFLISDIALIRSLLTFIDKQMKVDSTIFQFYGGLGLGMFVGALCRAGFVELQESDGSNAILKYAHILQDFAFSSEDDVKNGPLIGLTIATVALGQSGSVQGYQYVKDIGLMLKEKLFSYNQSSTSYDIVAFCTSIIFTSAANENVIPLTDVMGLTEWMVNKRNSFPNCAGTAQSLGVLLEALERSKSGHEDPFYEKLLKLWMTTLSSEQQMTLPRLAALKGLMAMFSGGMGLCSCLSVESKTISCLNDVARETLKFMGASRDAGLLGSGLWLLGLIFHNWREHQTVSVVTGVSSYSYLSDKSLLKPIVSCVTQERDENLDIHLEVCLRALAVEDTLPFPPINWGNILAAFLFHHDKPIFSALALKIILNQMSTSTTASALFTTCITKPNSNSLSTECQDLLLDSLPRIAKSLLSSKLQLLLQNVFLEILTSPKYVRRVLNAFVETLKLTDLPETSKKVLHDTVKLAIVMVSSESLLWENNEDVFLSLTNCAKELPDSTIEELVRNSGEFNITLRCSLVKVKRKPLTWLTPFLDNVPANEQGKVLCNLRNCCPSVDSSEERLAWLLALIGKSNHLMRQKSVDELSFLVKVFMVSILSWSRCYNITDDVLMWKMSGPLQHFLRCEDYASLTSKVLDWLLSLSQLRELGLSEDASQCMWLLRETKDFADPRIWTKVI